MKKLSLVGAFVKSTSRNERNLNAERARTRALRLEGLESRELLSVAPGSELLAPGALAVYESRVATPDDVLDLSAAMLDDAPSAPEYLTVTAPAPVGATPTPLATPTLTVEGKTGLTIAVSWNAVPNAERYSLSYKPSNSTTWTNKNVGTNTSYTISGLALDTSYDLRLKAIGDGVNYKSVYSSIISETTNATPDPSETPMPLATPTLSFAGRTGTTITVNWGAVDNAERYSFGYKLSSETTWTNKNVGTNTSYTVTGLDNNTSYDLRVKAIGDGETYKSVYSTVLTASTDASLTPLATPVLTIAGATTSTITVNWDAVANAERYSFSYKLASETTWKNVNVGTDTSYTITGLEKGIEYDVRVKAIADGVVYKSVYSPIVRAQTSATAAPLDTPVVTVDGQTATTISVSWEAVDNAERYSLSYKLANETTWTNVNVGTNTSYTITGLTQNTGYDVRLKAIGDGVDYKSVYSAIVSATTSANLIQLDPPRVNVVAAGTSMTVSWDAVENAERYSLSYKLASETEWTSFNVGTDISRAIPGLNPTTWYDVRVKAIGDDVNFKSSYSDVVRVQTTEGDWPRFTVTDVSNDSILLHWGATPNAIEYRVEWAPVGSTNFKSQIVTAPTSYARITGLSANTEYQIKINATTYDSTSEFSPVTTLTTSSTPFVKTQLATPVVSTRGISSDSIYVEWEADPRATGYIVSYKERTADSYSTINVAASERGLVLGGLESDASYHVRVKAVGDNVFWSSSTYSSAQTVKTKDASFLSTTEYGELRDRYNDLTLPESLSDVNIVILEDWTATAVIDAIEEARATAMADVILLEPEQYSGDVLDLSGVSITLDVAYETSGSISILTRGMDRTQIKANDVDFTFNAIKGLTQLGGIDFVDVNPETSVYQVISAPTLGIPPTAIEMQSVGMYTPAGVSVNGASQNFIRPISPTVSANPSVNDYALLFIGGYEARQNYVRYYDTLKDYYFELVEDFSLDPTKMYILYADGDASTSPQNMNSTDSYDSYRLTKADMSYATSVGSPIRAATGAELTETLAEIADLMTVDSHLFFWTYDHGSGVGKPENPKDVPTSDYLTNTDDYLAGWREKITGPTVRDALFQIKQGYVTSVFTQCYAGGILDDIFVPATGELSDLYTGSAHFAGGSATNHYENSFTRSTLRGYTGYAQTFEEAMRRYETGIDAFIYTERTDSFSRARIESYAPNEGVWVDDMEHPWHAGEKFPIFIGNIKPSAPQFVSHDVSWNTETESAEVSLTWNEVPGANTYTLQYVVAGADDSTAVTVSGISDSSYTVTGLVGATQYVFRVTADNTSTYSEPLPVWTPEPPTPETPSTVVTTDLDVVNAYDNLISLREAVSKYSVVGDTVTFISDLQGKTIKLDPSRGQLYVNKSLTIDASNLYDDNAQTPGLKVSGEDAVGILNLVAGKSLLVKGIEFTKGYSSTGGGAIWNSGALTVEDCVFSVNDANGGESYGGAIAVKTGATLTARSTSFVGNVGLGVVSFQTNRPSSFTDCVFASNDGISVYGLSGRISLTDCVVVGNSSAGVYVGDNEATLTNTVVKDNADSGVIVSSNGALTAINSLFADNATAGGAGVELYGYADLYNCTVAGNAGSGVSLDSDAVLSAYNTIIAGNAARNGVDVRLTGSNAVANGFYVLSSFTGWEEQTNAYVYNPSQSLFSDAAVGDYTLADDSVAIDTGNTNYVPLGVTTDLAGVSRVFGASVDLGAYEYIPDIPEPTKITPAPTITVTPGVNLATVDWDPIENASGYTVYYKPTGASDWTSASDISGTSYTVFGIACSTQ